MNRLNAIFIIIGICVAALIVVAVSLASTSANQTSYEMKLINGEVSIFQYCAHIGKAAIDDKRCQDYNVLYGPNN
jgi:hypothetical protein